MRIKPKPLASIIIFSFIFLVMTSCAAHRPETALGFAFWISFGVFAASMIHLAKNEKQYKNDLEDEHFG